MTTAAMILAAGLGTRLRPLTDELPKPLVPVGDRPMIAHVLAGLAAGGVRAATINVHHLAAAFEAALAALALPVPLAVVHEPALLGTAGGLHNAAASLGDGDVVVWNGDILADIGVAALIASRRGALAALAIAPRPAGEGTVGCAADGRVVRLRGERFGVEARGGDFLGVHAIGPELRAALPPRGCMVGAVYLPALRRAEVLTTLEVRGAWDDVGALEAYLAANRRWLAGRGLSAYVASSAAVSASADVSGSIVGAGATVTGSVRGCVVWPGARAQGPLEGAVVTTAGRVVRVG